MPKDYETKTETVEPKTVALAAELIYVKAEEAKRRFCEELIWQRLPVELLIAFGEELKNV